MSKDLLNVILLFGIVVVLFFVLDRYFKKTEKYEDVVKMDEDDIEEVEEVVDEPQHHDHTDLPQEKVESEVEEEPEKEFEQVKGREQLKPQELLPLDKEADAWASVNPKGKGSLEFKNFLEAGYHIGVDTQTNSLRNANRQIRSEPANPQVPVSIWSNSTIGFDSMRRPLEVGCESK